MNFEGFRRVLGGGGQGRGWTRTEMQGILDPPKDQNQRKQPKTKAKAKKPKPRRNEHPYTPARKRGGGYEFRRYHDLGL